MLILHVLGYIWFSFMIKKLNYFVRDLYNNITKLKALISRMSEPKIVELTSSNICKICENRLGKYSCPRCNILYCSVNCYQSQSHLECSETFYQKCVYEELKLKENDEESKRKMEDILRRFHDDTMELDSDDDDDTPELSERMANVNLDDVNKVWGLLTSDEKQEFESLINSGDLTKIVPIWEPWWMVKIENKLVQEVASSTQVDYVKNCPKVLENIKEFQEISKTQPNSCVKNNLLNILASYVCIVRYFNGEHFDFSKEAIYLITNLSKNLLQNENFESFSLALESVYQQILVNEWIKSDEDIRTRMYNDVKSIIQGPESNNRMFYILCALSDLYKLMLHSKKNLVKSNNDFSKRFQENELPQEKYVPKEKIKLYVRKIEYYLSYVTTFVPNFD